CDLDRVAEALRDGLQATAKPDDALLRTGEPQRAHCVDLPLKVVDLALAVGERLAKNLERRRRFLDGLAVGEASSRTPAPLVRSLGRIPRSLRGGFELPHLRELRALVTFETRDGRLDLGKALVDLADAGDGAAVCLCVGEHSPVVRKAAFEVGDRIIKFFRLRIRGAGRLA